MKKTPILFFISFFLSSLAFSASSNSEYIHNYLQKAGTCRNGAITDNWGYLVFDGQGRFAYSGIPATLAEYITAETNAGRIINDVCITERGNWFCVGAKINGVGYPDSMWLRIQDYLLQGDYITCVTFNDYGDWIVISNKHFCSSNNSIQNDIIKANEEYGFIRAATITNFAYIIVAERGSYSCGTIPPSLDDYLRNKQSFDIRYIKFTERGAWLVTDGYSQHAYAFY